MGIPPEDCNRDVVGELRAYQIKQATLIAVQSFSLYSWEAGQIDYKIGMGIPLEDCNLDVVGGLRAYQIKQATLIAVQSFTIHIGRQVRYITVRDGVPPEDCNLDVVGGIRAYQIKQATLIAVQSFTIDNWETGQIHHSKGWGSLLRTATLTWQEGLEPIRLNRPH